LSFDAQCTITDFYKEFNDVQAFEKAVMNILLSTNKEKSVLITQQFSDYFFCLLNLSPFD